jgi:hypothetical protein
VSLDRGRSENVARPREVSVGRLIGSVMALVLVAWTALAPLPHGVPVTMDYALHVERVWEMGISMGCSTDPFSFCPEELTTRDEMASLLARGLGLDPAIPPTPTDTTSTTLTSATRWVSGDDSAISGAIRILGNRFRFSWWAASKPVVGSAWPM